MGKPMVVDISYEAILFVILSIVSEKGFETIDELAEYLEDEKKTKAVRITKYKAKR